MPGKKHESLILVVDDYHDLLGRDLHALLEQKGYNTVRAATGREGLLLAKERKPDLILLDVALPDITGYEVCRRIKDDTTLKDTYVVLISSNGSDSDTQASEPETEADGYISRHAPNREFLSSIDTMLRLKRADTALKESESRFRTLADYAHCWEYWASPDGQLVCSPEGESLGIRGSISDITDRKRTEADVRETRDNLLAFIETIDDLVLVVSIDEKVIFANSAVGNKLGYSAEEIKSMRVLDFHPPSVRLEAEKIYGEMLKGNQVVCPLPLQKRNGDYFPVETRAWRGKWSGKDCMFGISKDLGREQEALQKFNRIFSFNPAPMAVSRLPERRITDVNVAFINALGYSRDEIIGRTSQELGLFANKTDQDAIKQMLSDCGRVTNLEIQARRKDGSIIDGMFSGEIIESQGEKSFLSVLIDISETIKVKKQLEARNSILDSTLESTADAILVADREGRVISYNQKFLDLWSIPPDIMKPRDAAILLTYVLDQLMHPDEFLEGVRNLNAAPGNVSLDVIEFRDGRVVELYSQPQMLGDKIVGRVWSFRDVTERIRAEQALKESEKRFRELAELLPQTVFELDMNGKFTFVNTAGLNLTGYSREEFLNDLSPLSLIAEEDRERALSNIQKRSAGEDVQIKPYGLTKKDGSSFPALIYSIPIVRDAQVVGLRGVSVDISPIRKAEEERDRLRNQLYHSQKMEALGTLVGGIAHDFNNMLQAIIGYAELLQDGKNPGDPTYKALQTILETGKGGAELVKKLLAFSQKTHLAISSFNLNGHIQQFVQLVSRTIPEIVRIDLDLGEAPPMVMADARYIEQVLMNLAINSAEAMPQGGKIKISTSHVFLDEEYCEQHLEARPGPHVLLTFRDYGRGISKEDLPRIFDPFFSTKQRGVIRGTGMGLAVVRGIIQLHGGHIACDSELFRGTEFKIYLPAVNTEPKDDETVPESVVPAKAHRIMIVDDNLFISSIEKTILEHSGHDVIVANNPIEAIMLFRDRYHEISLVILDLVMPEMSGRDCLHELLKIDPTARILIHSGYSPNDRLAEGLDKLTVGYLAKPCSRQELTDAVSKALEQVA